MTRTSRIERNTRETQITIELDLDGSGVADINCSVHFLGHMLDQIARHGRFDLKVNATGDVEVDAHHTVEDTAIALGQAFRKALGAPHGIERFGHARCPLDESIADVTVDLSGRAHAVVNCPNLPEHVGDLPTELFAHFIESFANNLKANVHVNVLYGTIGHHMIEASFKALARALHKATRTTGSDEIPSTKGLIEV
jgi:imidazoleglycerol phosphate dehydratase HisB